MPVLPQSIQVGAISYSVVVDNGVISRGNAADIDYEQATIHVNAISASTVLVSALLHEVLHAIWHLGNLAAFEGDVEKTLGALDGLLLDTLRRNPDLVAFLLDREA